MYCATYMQRITYRHFASWRTRAEIRRVAWAQPSSRHFRHQVYTIHTSHEFDSNVVALQEKHVQEES